MNDARRRPRGPRVALALAATALSGGLAAACGPAAVRPPAATRLVAAAARAMAAAPAHQLEGRATAGPAIVRFVVRVTRGGAFAGRVEATAPRMGTMLSDVIAIGARVYVRSPMALARLGILSLPGHRSPATTWVLEPPPLAAQYRSNVAPFTDAGLARTLWRTFRRARLVRRCRMAGRSAFELVARGRGMGAVVYVGAVHHHVLRLVVTGPQPVVLVFQDYGHVGPVVAPPARATYSPPRAVHPA